MAKKTFVELIDDIDGSKADTTVRFSWQGGAYEIDLSKKNAKAFEAAVEPYLAKATRVTSGRAGRRPASRGKGGDLSAVRSWAAANGYELATRGRIPATILEAYQASEGAGRGSSDSAKPAPRKGARRRSGARKG